MKSNRLCLACVVGWFLVCGAIVFPYWTRMAGLWPSPAVARAASATDIPEDTPVPVLTPTALPRSSLRVTDREVLRGNPNRPYVALTFDADSSPQPLAQILSTLRTKEISSTFFIQGSWAERFPDAVQAIIKDGHEIGNHSYSHPDFRELTDAQIVDELARAETALFLVTGATSRPFFRPPYSYRNDAVRRVAAEEGYLTVVWTYDAFDWKRNATEETIYAEIVGHAEPGAIYVQHVGDANSANALDRIVDGLRAAGLEPVTLSALLAE